MCFFTCWRLRLACKADPNFSSCFTLIFTISCRNFSFDSFESRPWSNACLSVSSSDSRFVMACPSAADTRGPSGVPTAGVRTAGTEVPGPEGELRSLAELEDVKDGDERDESDDVTEKEIKYWKWKRFKRVPYASLVRISIAVASMFQANATRIKNRERQKRHWFSGTRFLSFNPPLKVDW